MAEYTVAGILHFAKGLHRAAVDRGAGVFDHRAYRPLLLEGKTACVVGAGGIGLDVGKLCAALGMRVVGTAATRTQTGPCHRDSASLAAPGISIGSCRRAISW